MHPLERNTESIVSGGCHHAGSSPHGRGARRPRPGCAPGTRDHPRIRGEHVVSEQGGAPVLRIIPAYAGSTSRLQQT